MFTVLTVLGTRPEAIKMAPVILALEEFSDHINSVICATAQHRQMLDQVLDLFQISPDYDLDLMKNQQTLSQLSARVLLGIEKVLKEVKPDWVLVQGDTTTVMTVSLAAFYQGIKIGHVEAGLRTNNKRAPFPEEINRRITSVMADLHFAPTEGARLALLAEGVSDKAIKLTGNTVVDSLHWVKEIISKSPPVLPGELNKTIKKKRLILVTGHRRESFGEGFEEICLALGNIAKHHTDVCIVYPVHLNPNVQEPVYRILGGIKNVHLLSPLPYESFVWLMENAYLILTDSGGIQEEAPSFSKPVLVMRETTERQEGIISGNACLVGSSRERIFNKTKDLLTDEEQYRKMTTSNNPYGDGKAANRIVELLLEHED